MNNRSIWKYNLETSLSHQMPLSAEVLHAGYDRDGSICVWVLVNLSEEKVKALGIRGFIVAGTGWITGDPRMNKQQHIASLIHPVNGNVWHVFDAGWLKRGEAEGLAQIDEEFNED